MPWQALASDLLNVHDTAGRRIVPFLVVTVQRQSGKTTWVAAEVVERCLFGPPSQRVWYTAQSGQYARDMWAQVATELCDKTSPLAGYVAAKWTNGSECLTFPNGSTFRPFPPTRDALHGRQSDLVIVDEAWRHDAVRGAALLQAIGPTQATRPGAQVVAVSTMGTVDSTFLHPLVDAGRAAARSGNGDALAYLEYGIGPQGDPLDIENVIARHPAVGHTIHGDFVRQQATILSPGEFARAYGNVMTATEERYIPAELWAAAQTSEAPPEGVPPMFGAAVSLDRSRTAIVGAAGGIMELIEPGRASFEWAAPVLLELLARWPGSVVAVSSKGPSAQLHDHLAAELPAWERETRLRDAKDWETVAPQSLMDRLGRDVWVRPNPYLDQAADAAVPRNVGDGGWTWGRRVSGGPIAEIEAATWAAWADSHRPAAAVKPRIITV